MCIVITMLYYTEKEHILNPFCHLPTVLMPGAAPDPRSSSTLKRNVDNSAILVSPYGCVSFFFSEKWEEI